MRNVFYHQCIYCDWREYYFTNSQLSENRALKRVKRHEILHISKGEK